MLRRETMLVPKMKVVKYLTLNPLVVIQTQGLVEALGGTKARPFNTCPLLLVNPAAQPCGARPYDVHGLRLP